MAEDGTQHIDTIADHLEAGIAAAQAGQRPLARSLLTKVIELDERNAAAWLWLSRAVDDPEEQEICLENVLTLEPGNAEARGELEQLRAQKAPPPAAAPLPAGPAEEAPPPPTPAPPEGELPMPPVMSLEDRYLCPHCATRTRFEDRKCPACGYTLWQRSRQQEERTQSRIGFVLALQATAAGLNLLAIMLLLLYVSLQVRYPGVIPVLRIYLGASDAPPETVGAALALLPRLPVLILLGLLVLAIVVWAGIYLRWKPVFYLFLVSGGGLVVVGLLTTLTLWPVVELGDPVLSGAARVIMVVLNLGILAIVFGLAMEMREDFFFEQERIVYRLDSHAVEGIDFMAHGQRYAQDAMWALAAIHFRRAVDALTDDFEAQLKLAATYGNLGRYQVAGRYLANAAQARPADPRVRELETWLKRRGAGGGTGRGGEGETGRRGDGARGTLVGEFQSLAVTTQPVEEPMLRALVNLFYRLPPQAQQPLSKVWYEYISAMDRGADMVLMNYGWAGLDTAAAPLPLQPEDEPNRYCLQLYHHVASAVDLRGRDVLEVGCGRGGGAAYVARYLQPRSMTGLDLTANAINFCRQHYAVPGLTFVRGHAERLPFPPASFDAVVNVESSHCYDPMSSFLRSVRRVLKPGGYLLFADHRDREQVGTLRREFAGAGLTVREEQVINPNVVRALELDNARKQALIQRKVPPALQHLFGEFAAMEGTRSIYTLLRNGDKVYLRFVLQA